MRRRYIIDKEDKKALNPDIVGAKAARLALMARHDIPVPDFVVISTRAYKAFYKHGYAYNKQIRNILKDIPLLQTGSALAVRSSSPFEDQYAHSMAGLFQTFLNVQNLDDIVSAIQNCWSSLHSNVVQNYLDQFSYSPRDRKIAVILQKMTRPDFAGVLFTKHPVTRDPNTIVIEAIPGIGEELVSGQKEPTRIFIDRQELKNAPETHRAFTIVPENPAPSLDHLHELLNIALEVESLFEGPQDIEWAIEGDRVWILQARPITSGIGHYSHFVDQNGRIWSNYFFVERFNKPLSPLGWTFLRDLIEKNAFREPLWYLGEEKVAKQPRLTLLKNGMPYTELKVFQRLYKLVPRQFISEDKKKSLLLESTENNWITELVKTMPYLFARLVFYDLNWFPPTHLRHWYKFEKNIDSKLDQYRQRLDEIHTLCDLRYIFANLEHLSDRFLSLHRWSITFADIFYALLRRVLQKVLGSDARTSKVDELLSGFAENETLRANLMLAEMGRLHSKNKLTPDKMAEFMNKFGHRSESLDIMEPNWKEMPETINSIVHQIGESGKARHILRESRSKINNRLKAEREVFAAIAKQKTIVRDFHKVIFKIVLHYAQQFSLLRENQRNVWQKILALTRFTALKIGQVAVDQNILQEPSDIFFITKSKVYEFLDRKIDNVGNLSSVVSVRKRQWHNQLKHSSKITRQLPIKLKGKLRNQEVKLEGIGVSTGRVSGTAKLASTFNEAVQVRHGQILVAHSADPGWTPLFGVISGLVLEVGGVLSHASIVAREFGLPAVTSVPEATKMIHEGDMIEVDGEQGTVHILKRAS